MYKQIIFITICLLVLITCTIGKHKENYDFNGEWQILRYYTDTSNDLELSNLSSLISMAELNGFNPKYFVFSGDTSVDIKDSIYNTIVKCRFFETDTAYSYVFSDSCFISSMRIETLNEKEIRIRFDNINVYCLDKITGTK